MSVVDFLFGDLIEVRSGILRIVTTQFISLSQLDHWVIASLLWKPARLADLETPSSLHADPTLVLVDSLLWHKLSASIIQYVSQ